MSLPHSFLFLSQLPWVFEYNMKSWLRHETMLFMVKLTSVLVTSLGCLEFRQLGRHLLGTSDKNHGCLVSCLLALSPGYCTMHPLPHVYTPDPRP